MYEGKEKTYYRGYAISADEFIIAAIVDELTAPDEAPYLSNQLTFNVDGGWSSIWYEDDVIVDFTLYGDNSVLALSESAGIFDARSGGKIQIIDHGIHTHMNSITSHDAEIAAAGTNGRFYVGNLTGLEMLPNRYFVPTPGAEATTEERISWALNMKFFYSIMPQGEGVYTIAGSHGLILRVDNKTIHDTEVIPNATITDLAKGFSEHEVIFCGHTPKGVIGKFLNVGVYELIYTSTENEGFTSVDVFSDEIYVADSNPTGGVFILRDGLLVGAPFSDVGSFGPARSVQSKDGVLWALFEKALVRYDGEAWEVFRHSETM